MTDLFDHDSELRRYNEISAPLLPPPPHHWTGGEESASASARYPLVTEGDGGAGRPVAVCHLRCTTPAGSGWLTGGSTSGFRSSTTRALIWVTGLSEVGRGFKFRSRIDLRQWTMGEALTGPSG
jgi:hypothetical protein